MQKVLLIVCAIICSIGISTAQSKLQPYNWEFKYRGEVSAGVAASNVMRIPPTYGTICTINSLLARPTIETVHGLALSNYMTVGMGIGFQFYGGTVDELADYIYFKDNKNTWGMIAIPLFINTKGFIPLDNDFKPFTTLSIGRTQMVSSNANIKIDNTYYENDLRIGEITMQKMSGGFYCDWGVGIEYKQCSLAIGVQHQRYALKDIYINYSIAKYGLCSVKDRDILNMTIMYSNSFYFKVGISF